MAGALAKLASNLDPLMVLNVSTEMEQEAHHEFMIPKAWPGYAYFDDWEATEGTCGVFMAFYK